MIKWILIGSLFYFFFKAFIPMLSIFKFGQAIKEKKKKERINKKVSEMDILDAEFDDNIK